MRVVWSPTAIAHLAEIRTCIEQDKPETALSTAKRIVAAIDRLEKKILASAASGVIPVRANSLFPAHPTLSLTRLTVTTSAFLPFSIPLASGPKKTKGTPRSVPLFLFSANLCSLRASALSFSLSHFPQNGPPPPPTNRYAPSSYTKFAMNINFCRVPPA
jgi:hypothetical protein